MAVCCTGDGVGSRGTGERPDCRQEVVRRPLGSSRQETKTEAKTLGSTVAGASEASRAFLRKDVGLRWLACYRGGSAGGSDPSSTGLEPGEPLAALCYLKPRMDVKPRIDRPKQRGARQAGWKRKRQQGSLGPGEEVAPTDGTLG